MQGVVKASRDKGVAMAVVRRPKAPGRLKASPPLHRPVRGLCVAVRSARAPRVDEVARTCATMASLPFT